MAAGGDQAPEAALLFPGFFACARRADSDNPHVPPLWPPPANCSHFRESGGMDRRDDVVPRCTGSFFSPASARPNRLKRFEHSGAPVARKRRS